MNSFLRFVAARGNKNPELLVYGDIGGWWGDVQARDFAEQLQAIDAPEIDVRINSDGGAVFTAQAIYSSLKHHPAKINVYIDGIAASAATIIMMAGDRIIMPENAMIMVHNPLINIFGNAEELREWAETLDKVAETIKATYRQKTGLDDETLDELLSKDTFMSASEALEYGFVDEVTPALEIAAKRGENGTVIINGLTVSADRCKRLPNDWLNSVKSHNEPQEKELVAMTLDELKAQHPELYEAVIAKGAQEGQEQERARIKAIDEMVIAGHEDLAAQAKYETGISAEAFAVEVVKAEKAAKDKFLSERAADAEVVNKVAPSEPAADAEDEKKAQVVNSIAAGFGAKRKEV